MATVLPVALVRKFRAVEDRGLRRRLIAASLSDLDEPSIALFLGHVADRAGSSDLRPIYLDTVLALLEPGSLATETRREVHGRLSEHPLRPVLDFLCEAAGGRPPAASLETPYDYEDVALGVRKARARLRNRDVLRTLASDPDPEVVRILLDNPQVTESEAVRVASLRPQTPATFRVVLSSLRFGVREIVHTAVVLNPFCPLRVALALVPLLSRVRLAEAAGAPSLDPRVHDAALAVLGR